MCDYSLNDIRSRAAVEGEPLQVYRFSTGSLGLASPNDLQPREQKPAGLWQAIKDWLGIEDGPPIPCVCVPPGARLILREIPSAFRQKLNVGEEEEVTFVQLPPTPPGYRDGIRFDNGKDLVLQRLPKGLKLDVLTLPGSDELKPDEPREAAAFSR
jgi:hypothetical protein